MFGGATTNFDAIGVEKWMVKAKTLLKRDDHASTFSRAMFVGIGIKRREIASSLSGWTDPGERNGSASIEGADQIPSCRLQRIIRLVLLRVISMLTENTTTCMILKVFSSTSCKNINEMNEDIQITFTITMAVFIDQHVVNSAEIVISDNPYHLIDILRH